MSVEVHEITSHAEWLQLRRQDVTASVVGALLGVHEYQTRYGLFALKRGDVEEDIETTGPMMRGLLLEPVALKLLQIERPDWKIEWNGKPGIIGGNYYRDPERRLGATPDCFAIDPKRGRGVIQVKTTIQPTFRKSWFHQDYGSEEGESSAPEAAPPLWVASQAILEGHLTGVEWAAAAVLVVGYGLDIHLFEVPIHTGVINRIREATGEFWDRIARNDPYPPDYARDGETIAALYGQDNGREIDLSSDNRVRELLEERETLTVTRKTTKEDLEKINNELKHKLGANVAGYLPGWEITNKVVNRKGYAVSPTTYRSLRVKRIGA